MASPQEAGRNAMDGERPSYPELGKARYDLMTEQEKEDFDRMVRAITKRSVEKRYRNLGEHSVRELMFALIGVSSVSPEIRQKNGERT